MKKTIAYLITLDWVSEAKGRRSRYFFTSTQPRKKAMAYALKQAKKRFPTWESVHVEVFNGTSL